MKVVVARRFSNGAGSLALQDARATDRCQFSRRVELACRLDATVLAS